MVKKLGIMGGTFDPIHYGHLLIAEEARFDFGLEKVLFIPSGNPPHKKEYEVSPGIHRLRMVETAIRENPYFEVSSLELDRPGPSYTVDTLQAVRGLYPGAEVFFITGADAILEILTWHRVEEVVGLCRFIAATRPGFAMVDLNRGLAGLPEHYRDRISPLEIPGLAVSSTALRGRVASGRPIKYLLPETVERYIFEKRLYKKPPQM